MILRPDYIKKISAYIDTPLVKVLAGVRRCGKSTILRMVAEILIDKGISRERILTYNFESMQHESLKTAVNLYNDVKKRIPESGKIYLFLDEIQEVQNWERAVNSFMVDFDVDIYVTGSNSRMLSSEISTHLTGRYIQFHVYPLSFEEFLRFRERWLMIEERVTEAKNLDRYKEFVRYFEHGGFPAVHLREFTTEESYAMVKSIYDSTIFTDIVKRGEIRKIDLLERIVKFAFDNVGKTFSASSVVKYLKSQTRSIDIETVYSYLRKLESAFILHRCSRFDLCGKDILKTQEKFYICDPAMRYSVLGYTDSSVSAMLENVVYLELLRRGYEVNVGQLKVGEIDFVANKRENRIYVQVTRTIESQQTEEREYGRLLDIRDNFPKYVIRTDEFTAGNYQGIKTMHIADFLLSDEY
jgi:predicted AAA+ superfamily ATPase